jgi:hydroxymethylpyrimidine pyrophosphatase-like HAD family hydrolase
MDMSLPFRVISTDFDGTLHADGEVPPVPVALQRLIARLQAEGVSWVINTGRDLGSLMETLGRAHLSVRPDYLVVVEREIYLHDRAQYLPLTAWNQECARVHAALFARVREDLPGLMGWVNERFADASVYEDAWSPFCLIAGNNGDADVIHEFLEEYRVRIPGLAVVRNDIYARFSHEAYSKGTALSEVARLVGATSEEVLAAGDHLNDMPMLSREHARWLVAPSNSIPEVKELVRRQEGYVSRLPHGHGVMEGIEYFLRGGGEFGDDLNGSAANFRTTNT